VSFSGWNDVFKKLMKPGSHHMPGSPEYTRLKQEIRTEVEKCFSIAEPKAVAFGPFGELVFPYFKMGNIDSMNLFDLDELIIFSFYWKNRKKYHRVLDVGANIGLHSVILSKCDYEVQSYEPDPIHFKMIERNLELNKCRNVKVVQAAVSSQQGEMEFIRVLGNTTGSHLAGSKPNPYGQLEKFIVKVDSFKPLLAWADLVKMDVEGHEKVVLESTRRGDWTGKDALVEIENEENAAAVYEYSKVLGVNLFTQKTGWQKVSRREDMPSSYHDGTLFVSSKSKMPW
jgi:FkbM family methyltransferase